MNKADLVIAISEKTGSTRKEAEKALRAFEEVITEELVKGGKVQLVGFGTFDVAERQARVGMNPKTKEAINIEASKAPRFRAGKALKDLLNEK